jgi:hypothetical protein
MFFPTYRWFLRYSRRPQSCFECIPESMPLYISDYQGRSLCLLLNLKPLS